jgi:hypothetical protein
MAAPKDLVLGILGASGALTELLLVLGGFIFAQAAYFTSDNQDSAVT